MRIMYIHTLDECGGVGGGGGSTLHRVGTYIHLMSVGVLVVGEVALYTGLVPLFRVPHALALVHKRNQK